MDLLKDGVVPFIDLSKEDVTRENVEFNLQIMPQITGVVFYNHGSETCLYAQNGKDCVIDSKNASLLKDKILYTLACLYGKDGGWEAHRKGAQAVHCYTEIVGFMTSALTEFQEAFNHGFKLLLELGPHFTAISKAEKEKFTELSDNLMARGDFMSAMWMNRNRDSVVWYNGGDEPPESKCFWRRLAVRIFGTKIDGTFGNFF